MTNYFLLPKAIRHHAGWPFPFVDTDASFVYNENGLCVQKTVNGVVTKYTLYGKNIVHMTQGSNELHFFYDSKGKPAVVVYNDTPYIYVKNLQGDIVAILNSAGTAVVNYVYDAWGRPISKTGSMAATLGTVQPFRYRGYVYDEETALYYLRNRYYSAKTSRFINSDSLIVGSMYNYCHGNPVNRIDLCGRESTLFIEPINTIGGLPVTSQQYKDYRAFMDQYTRVMPITFPPTRSLPPYATGPLLGEIYDVCYETETKDVLTVWGHICAIAEGVDLLVEVVGSASANGLSAVIFNYTGYYIPPDSISGVLDTAGDTTEIIDGINELLKLNEVDHTHTVHRLYVYRREALLKTYIYSFETCSMKSCKPNWQEYTRSSWMARKEVIELPSVIGDFLPEPE